jgi:LAS superfamily LD-carboxypeptidase LdcB
MAEQALDFSLGSPDSFSAPPGNVFGDPSFLRSFSDTRSSSSPIASGDQLTLGDIYPSQDGVGETPQPTPFLSDELKQQLAGADSLVFSTPDENKTANEQPDYRIVVDDKGNLTLERVGTGDPLADGKLNIEMDPKANESLAEAIKQADKNLKEFIREMMYYWRQNHPGEEYPGWWNDILNSTPDVPADAQPVPIRDASTTGGGGGQGGGWSGGGGDGGGYRGGVGPGYSGPGQPAPVEGNSSLLHNVQIVKEIAEKHGVDPLLAVATMLQESGGNSRAIGDGGDSVGLFQLNENGLGAGMSVEERMDPRKNAEIAIAHMAQTQATDQNGDGQITGGDLAVSSQRPAEHVRDEYVANVDGPLRQQAAQLIEQADKADDFDPAVDTGAWGGFQNGRIPQDALAEVYGFKVAPSIQDNLTAMLHAAQADGVWSPDQPYATGTYRSYEDQVRLKEQKGDMAATPGKSMHGWGLAIDFNMNNQPLINWLADNAERFGFKNLPGEPWHYSTNGH